MVMKILRVIKFLNYKNVDNANDLYSNLTHGSMGVIDKVAPVQNKKIGRNSQGWFDSEISERRRDKLIKNTKKSRFYVDKYIHNHRTVSFHQFLFPINQYSFLET